MIKDKRGVQLAISTLILIILGIIILIGLITILVMGWGNFKAQIQTILGSENSKIRRDCEIQCELGNSYDYCCEEKSVGDEEKTCLELLNEDCSCEGRCEGPPSPPLV
jgi:hypothetical protein